MPVKTPKPGSLTLTLLLGSCCIASPVLAQTPPDAGQVLRDTQSRPIAAPPLVTPVLRIEEPSERGASTQVRFDIRSLRFTGNVAFSANALAALVADIVGPGRSLQDLEVAARRISAYYREQGYAVARAYIPAQDIRDGLVTIAVLEGELGRTTLDNRSGLPATQAQAVLDTLPAGLPVRTEETNRALLLLGELPGIAKVDGRLRPGDRLGSSDLLITVEPGKAAEGGISADNFGNRFTGANRLTGQLVLNNPLALADRLSLRGTVSDAQLLFGRAAWDAAVGANGLRAGVSASASRYELAEEFEALQAHGSAQTAGVYATYPLLLQAHHRVRLGASLEKRWIKDRIDSVDSSVNKSAQALVLELSGDRADGLGGGGLSNWRLGTTFGQLSIDTPSALAADQASARTDGVYAKWTTSIAREQRLLAGFSAYASASGQWASRNLDSSEKFVLGGIYGIRAYPQGEAAGDQGWLANVELRYAFLPTLQGALFYDAGGIDINHRPFIAGNNQRSLSGHGIGLSATMDSFSLSASVAWRGGSEAPTSDRDKTPRLWLQGVWRF